MLKVYDQNHRPVGILAKYNDLKIESDLETGDKKMSFRISGKPDVIIKNEYYLQTRYDEFVVKRIKKGKDFEAVLNLETLEGMPFDSFSITNQTIKEAVAIAIDGTGWSLGYCDIPDSDKRNAGMIDCDALKVITNLCTVWMCEPEFDTLLMKVNIYKQRGADKGCYFASGLNLRSVDTECDSYDFYTRIIPKGADDLDITSINGGKNYLENYSYSNKVKTIVWKDESYTDAQALKDDAESYLNDLSQPKYEIQCDVIDLAKQSSLYNVLSYDLGDYVTVIDAATRTRTKQRIVHLTEYPRQPWKNSCEMANKRLRFTDLLDKRKNAESIEVYSVDGGKLGTTTLSSIIKNLKRG